MAMVMSGGLPFIALPYNTHRFRLHYGSLFCMCTMPRFLSNMQAGRSPEVVVNPLASRYRQIGTHGLTHAEIAKISAVQI